MSAAPAHEILFAWAHLSDLHVGRGGAPGAARRRLMLEALARDLAGVVDRGCPALDALFVTGDIAWSGAEAEYAEARTLLLRIAQTAEIGLDRMYVVAGEHDVDRTADQDRNAARLLDGLRRGDPTLDDALGHDGDAALIRRRLDPYLAFAAGLASSCANLFWSTPIEGQGGLRVRLVGLDTVLAAKGEEDEGKLRLGGAQLAEALGGPGDDELIVVMSHHPFSGGWLADPDEKEADRWIANHAHLHLFGHGSHVRSEEARSGGGGPFVRIAAGDCGYGVTAIVRRADGGLVVRVWPRRWSEEQKHFVDDVDNMRGSGPAEHALRRLDGGEEKERRGAETRRRKKAERIFEGAGGVPIAPVPHFMGRDEEMRALRAALEQDKAVCVVATGLGGIGKTSLVRQLVAEHGPEMFPDGSVWIDATSLDVDVARACRRFGYEGERQPTVAEGARFLATALHEQRVLVVIDNVSEAGTDPKVLPVVGGKSRTVVTSRAVALHESLDKPARAITLGRWSDDACQLYLRDVVPSLVSASDKDLGALASFVGHLPLAMRLLARLLLRPGSMPARLLDRLEREPLGTLDKFASEAGRGVVQTFNASFEILDETQRRVLLALAACARVTTEGVVARVAGLSVDEIGDLLADLAERSLIEHVEGLRWTLHDLMRLFLREQDGTQQADEVHLAFAEQHAKAHRDPLDWQAMEAGIEEVLTALDRLIASGDVLHATGVVQLAGAHLMKRGRYVELLVRYELLARRLAEGGEELAIICGNAGICCRALGDISKAIEYHQRGLAIYEHLGRLQNHAAALGNLGSCYRHQGNIPKAIEHIQRALALFETLGRLDHQAGALCNLGICYQAQGDIPNAIEHFERGLSLAEKVGQIEGQAPHLGNLGSCYREQGDGAKAIEYFQCALALFEKLGLFEGQAIQLHNLGVCCRDQGDSSGALQHYERALALYRRIGLPDHHPRVRMTLAAIARVSGT